jgi:hypothetical protein
LKNKLNINFVDKECVDITFSETFRLDLDERGGPTFPQVLKEKLPPYVPETVEQRIRTKRQNPNQGPIYTAVRHDPWCPETSGLGRCNCNPDVPYLEIKKYSGEKPTCNVCGESSTREIRRSDVIENGTGRRDRFWIEGGDMFYCLVAVTGTECELLICDPCMTNLGVKIYEFN